MPFLAVVRTTARKIKKGEIELNLTADHRKMNFLAVVRTTADRLRFATIRGRRSYEFIGGTDLSFKGRTHQGLFKKQLCGGAASPSFLNLDGVILFCCGTYHSKEI